MTQHGLYHLDCAVAKDVDFKCADKTESRPIDNDFHPSGNLLDYRSCFTGPRKRLARSAMLYHD